jgi:hypothetical protein
MRALTRRPLPAYLDLVDWMLSRGHARSRREAREVILAGRVKANSHTLGVGEQPYLTPDGKVKTRKIVLPHVPADLRPDIIVSAA